MPPGGIRTRNLRKRAVADLRLRPRGNWERHSWFVAVTNTGWGKRKRMGKNSKRVWKEEVITFSRYCTSPCLKILRNMTKHFSEDTLYPGRCSNSRPSREIYSQHSEVSLCCHCCQRLVEGGGRCLTEHSTSEGFYNSLRLGISSHEIENDITCKILLLAKTNWS
jgi:hypothetical protein